MNEIIWIVSVMEHCLPPDFVNSYTMTAMIQLLDVTFMLNEKVKDFFIAPDNFYYWFFSILAILGVFGAFIIYRLYTRRNKTQKYVLQKKVELRTFEINQQKEELEKKSKELQKAYEEIQTKNIAIEEAFQHLSSSYGKLSDLNREKDGMMSIVAHDLRTPLNNIEGLIQLISLDDNLNTDQREYINTIRTVVRRGNDMIRDLLDINQAQSLNPELKITEFGLKDFIEEWRFNFEKPLEVKNQSLVISGDLDHGKLKTDAGVLSRILDNLMSNAMKFSEMDKSIYLDLESIDDQLKLILKDEGPGISEADQEKMFKPFTRLSARPTNGEHSNGLGLSIIKSLTKQLGGKLEVESELGEGTSFIILIPKVAKNKAKKKLVPSV